MRKVQYSFYVLALCALAACSVMPQNTGERIAAAYVTHEQVLNTAAQAVRAGRLSADEGESILKGADDARSLLDVSADLGSDDILDQAIAVLEALEGRLQ